MAKVRPIVRYGADVLQKVAKPVTNITAKEKALVDDMIQTMYKAPGVGLAANQVGVSQRIMVTDISVGERKHDLIVLVNPEIVETVGEQCEEEGCLSLPGFTATVVRPKLVIVRGLDLDGGEIVLEGRELLARAFCHEIDHLNGLVFLDHLSFLKRDLIKRKIRKLERQGEWN